MAQRTIEGLHVAIIMDGNGRWATQRHLPRVAGHRAGVEALRRMVEACPELGIATLTVYAFSSDNWKRPSTEVSALMRLFHNYLQKESARCQKKGVRISVIGRRERLPPLLVPEIERTERVTAGGGRLHLRLAVDYSSRDAILAVAEQLGSGLSRRNLSSALGPDVDLLIRTGGEQRLSDFLLWECAYAEFVFAAKMWPDFQAADLGAAVADFQGRDRRFGAIVA
jgi:undecaprenyl diphosphate synthase